MKSDYQKLLFKTVQYAVGVIALVWLIRQVEWDRAVDLVTRMNPVVFGAILVLTLIQVLCQFSMWHVLLNGLHRTPFTIAARVNLTVSFINQIIPSRISGRSAAPVVMRYYTSYSWSDVVSVTGLHTALYALLNGGIAFVGLILFRSELSPGILLVLGGSTALYIIVGSMILIAGLKVDSTAEIFSRGGKRFRGFPLIGSVVEKFSQEIPDFTEDTADAFSQLATSPLVVALYSAGWAIGLMVVPGIRTWLLLQTLNVTFSLLLLPVVLVTAYTVTLLPLTPGGLGVAEATAALVFVALGVPAAAVAPVILLDRLLGVYLPSLIGWYPTVKMDIHNHTRKDI